MITLLKRIVKAALRSVTPKIKLENQTVFINKNSWQLFDQKNFSPGKYNIIKGDIRLVKKADLDRIVAYIGAIDKPFLKKMPKLKYLQIPSHGHNGFDEPSLYASESVFVSNVKDVFSVPIAEYCVTAYRLFGCYGLAKSIMPGISVSDIYLPDNVKVMIFGAGNIGKKLAELCKKQGWTVWGVKRNIPCEIPCCYDRIVTPDQARELLGEADYVVNLLPLTDETRNHFDLNFFKQMKKTALFCNVGRGASVNEDDLVYAVKNKIIRGAAMDASTRKSFKCPNIICTHHTSSISPDNAVMLDKTFTSQLNLFLSGKTPDNVFLRKGRAEVE